MSQHAATAVFDDSLRRDVYTLGKPDVAAVKDGGPECSPVVTKSSSSAASLITGAHAFPRAREATIQAYTAERCAADPDFLRRLVATYRDIFGAAPWNEWKICAFCGEKYGRADVELMPSGTCLRCGLGCLMDFHSPARVIERLYAETAMPGASPFMFVAEAPVPPICNQILGFTWGFGLPLGRIVDYIVGEYFTDLPSRVAQHARSSLLHSLAYCCPTGNTTYISEVAVIESARGSAMLFAQMLQAMAEQQVAAGYPGWVLWTSRQSRAYHIATLLGGIPLYQVDEVIRGDDRLLIAGDSSQFLAVCAKYPADKLISYFVKAARDLKTATAGK